MKMISSLFIPLLVLVVIIYGAYKKVNVYDSFISGAKEGLPMVTSMFFSLLAMIFGVNIFLNSGIIDYFFDFLKPILVLIHIPVEVLPVAIMRPLSGSFGLALLKASKLGYFLKRILVTILTRLSVVWALNMVAKSNS